jgi:hypothetical protein
MPAYEPPLETERIMLQLFKGGLGGNARTVPANPGFCPTVELGQAAKVHGIVPWLLDPKRSVMLQAIPEALATEWRAWEQHNRLLVLANWAVTTHALGTLDAAGIVAMPIKGVALSQQLYGSPWLRPAGDVDLLVERRVIPAAHQALLSAGFVTKDLFATLSANQWRWLLNNDHQVCYRDPQSGLLVELHWRMHGNGLLNNLDESWIDAALGSSVRGKDAPSPYPLPEGEREKMEVDVLGRRVPVLPAPILYLLVMSHLVRSHWWRLIWVLDSWKALEAARGTHSKMELDAIIARHGADRIHRRFLALMQQLLGDDRLSPQLSAALFPPAERMRNWGSLHKGWDGLCFQLGLRGSLRYKLAVLRSYLVGPSDFLVLRLPGWLFWLYVPLRIPLYVYRRYFPGKDKTGFPPARE